MKAVWQFAAHRPRATFALIAASLLVFAINYLAGGRVPGVFAPLLFDLGKIQSGEWWRLLTPIFLHFGVFHIVFNLLWTWEFGRIIETRHGAAALLALTAMLGVASNFAQFHIGGHGFFGGMSGVIYGYFGYLWIQGLCNRDFGFRLTRPVVYLLLGWFAVAWLGTSLGIFKWINLHIANTAHTAGLLGGIIIAFAAIAIGRCKRAARLKI